MNYKIEDGYDFYSALLEDSNDEEDDLCMLSNMPLNASSVALPCGHKYNYINLYNEIIAQKSSQRTSIEENRLRYQQFRCPYCRTVYSKLIPFIDIDGVKKISGVNSSVPSSSLNLFPCSWTIQRGKRCGEQCGKHSFNPQFNKLCKLHNAVAERRAGNIQLAGGICKARLKSGPRKGQLCGSKCDGEYCKRHIKLIKKV